MSREQVLRRRIQWLTGFFIVGLAVSGATAIPLRTELDWITQVFGLDRSACEAEMSSVGFWIMTVRESLHAVSKKHPFLLYGTDWLAFGHFAIAIAFVGVLRGPVRNRWLFDFGLIACVLVILYAIIFGEVRGIPFFWRLIDGSFGVVGFVPLWFCRKWVREIEDRNAPPN